MNFQLGLHSKALIAIEVNETLTKTALNTMEKKVPNRICSRCIYDDSISGISFDGQGVCNYCHQVEQLKQQFGTGSAKGEESMKKLIEDIKVAGKGKKYDCIVGVSGGVDSSFLLAKSMEWGLRPLAVHYDNTWNSAIATENIRKVTSKLDADLYTYVVDNKEADDIFRSFFFASVPEIDAPTDIGFAQVLRAAANKFGVKYILEGHSFVAEGISAIGSNYFDGKYIEDIHNKFGRLKMKTFPNMTFARFMKWNIIKRFKFVRPLWYIDYSKEAAREYLEKEFGWQYYGGHHLENRSSAFAHNTWLPGKFGLDFRNWTIAARVRAGLMSREAGIDLYFNHPVQSDPELVAYFKKRTGVTDEEFERVMKGPNRSFREFKTYKKRFERLRPLFKILAEANIVPMSFYLKYCFPLPAPKTA